MRSPSSLDNIFRLAALRRARLLDTSAESRFDEITELATDLLACPVSLLTLVDENRQFFKSQVGLTGPFAATRETPLSHSFCQYVVTTESDIQIPDARKDPLFKASMAVTDLDVIAYLGVPVRSNGEVIGALCAIDSTPRQWSDQEVRRLKKLARVVEEQITIRMLALENEELAVVNDTLAKEYHHRVKNALAVSAALVKMTARTASSVEQMVSDLNPRFLALATAHDALMIESDQVDLKDLISKLLLPYCMPGATADADGPSLKLRNDQVTPMCLLIHELATNSAKYGAFSNSSAVSVRWTQVADGVVNLKWSEELVNNKVDGSGFGTTLLEAAARQLRGTLKSKWSETRLEASLVFPVDDIHQRP